MARTVVSPMKRLSTRMVALCTLFLAVQFLPASGAAAGEVAPHVSLATDLDRRVVSAAGVKVESDLGDAVSRAKTLDFELHTKELGKLVSSGMGETRDVPVAPVPAPLPPALLTVETRDGNAELSWMAPLGLGSEALAAPTAYRIYRIELPHPNAMVGVMVLREAFLSVSYPHLGDPIDEVPAGTTQYVDTTVDLANRVYVYYVTAVYPSLAPSAAALAADGLLDTRTFTLGKESIALGVGSMRTAGDSSHAQARSSQDDSEESLPSNLGSTADCATLQLKNFVNNLEPEEIAVDPLCLGKYHNINSPLRGRNNPW